MIKKNLKFQKEAMAELAKEADLKPDKKKVKVTPLKSINAEAFKKVRTHVLISDISPGTSLLKGYWATCTGCGRTKTVYSKTKKDCWSLFYKQLQETDEKPCAKKFGTEFEEIRDTGYLCGGYDPLDSGSAPQFSMLFFSNKIIPQTPKEREQFESDIQTKPLIIYGEIKFMPSNKKITEWFIDVEEYKFEEKHINVDYKLLDKFKETPKDNEFFQKNFAPSVYKKELIKKIYALTLLSPLNVKFKDTIIPGIFNIIEAGDPGQAKTQLFNEMLKYCKDITNAKLISIENSTNRGIIGAVIKNPTTGQYMVKMGKLTLCHGGLVGLDGFGKLNPEDYAELRGIQEEHKFQINKAGGINKDCYVRFIALSNLINNVDDYLTKHKASYDISANTLDKSGKFSGADRRRYAHIIIPADRDTSASEIDAHMFEYDNSKEKEIIDYWNNLREFAWSLKEEDFEWEEGILEEIKKVLDELRKEFNIFSLDYGILSKGGIKQFLCQLPSVAILHESIKDKKVIIKKEHIKWLLEIYYEELFDLGLHIENERRNFLEFHAKNVLEFASEKLKKVIALLRKYGSQSAIEKSGTMSRKSVWRYLNEVISYKDNLNKEDKRRINYCPNHGSGSVFTDNWNKKTFDEPDGNLPPIMKRDGTLTDFGKILTKISVPLVPLDPYPLSKVYNTKNIDNRILDNRILDNNRYGTSETSETFTHKSSTQNVPLKSEKPKNEQKSFKSLQNIENFVVLKNEEPYVFNLEKDKIYQISDLGDYSEEIFKILESDGKVKEIENDRTN